MNFKILQIFDIILLAYTSSVLVHLSIRPLLNWLIIELVEISNKLPAVFKLISNLFHFLFKQETLIHVNGVLSGELLKAT